MAWPISSIGCPRPTAPSTSPGRSASSSPRRRSSPSRAKASSGLDDSIRRYFPEGPPAWRGITIRHLLTHTSGIPDYTDSTMDYRRDYTEEQLVALAAGLPLQFRPGAHLELQQHRLRPARFHRAPGERQVLWRLPARAGLRAAGDAHRARDLRERHRAQPRRRLPAGGRRAEEPGVGLADAQHHGRRLTLPHGARPGALGQRTQSRAGARQRRAPRELDAGPAQRRRDLPLRPRAG